VFLYVTHKTCTPLGQSPTFPWARAQVEPQLMTVLCAKSYITLGAPVHEYGVTPQTIHFFAGCHG